MYLENVNLRPRGSPYSYWEKVIFYYFTSLNIIHPLHSFPNSLQPHSWAYTTQLSVNIKHTQTALGIDRSNQAVIKTTLWHPASRRRPMRKSRWVSPTHSTNALKHELREAGRAACWSYRPIAALLHGSGLAPYMRGAMDARLRLCLHTTHLCNT